MQPGARFLNGALAGRQKPTCSCRFSGSLMRNSFDLPAHINSRCCCRLFLSRCTQILPLPPHETAPNVNLCPHLASFIHTLFFSTLASRFLRPSDRLICLMPYLSHNLKPRNCHARREHRVPVHMEPAAKCYSVQAGQDETGRPRRNNRKLQKMFPKPLRAFP